MWRKTRRSFLQHLAVGSAALGGTSLLGSVAAELSAKRRFTMDLVCGAIGVKADQRTAISLAQKFGFESVGASPAELATLTQEELNALSAEMKAKGLVWGAAGLPVDFRGEETKFHADLKGLPELAQGLHRAGVTRVSTWLRPAHDKLTYLANFKQHAARLRQVAQVLGDHGLRFGLEYVGPQTSRATARHTFVHSLAETRELIAEIGRDNLGVVLDSWHWYTAHESKEDLLTLTNKNVVACDLNDAPAGIPVDEQQDSRRELPAATGVIDLRTFLGALVEIGYDGPVRAEPFSRTLNDMHDEEAVAATSTAMKKAFSLVA